MYPLGILFYTFLILRRNRHKLFISLKLKRRYGMLYARYEQQYYYWELTEMARKLLLCSLIIYVQPGTIMQVIGAMAIASIFTCAHIKCQPFEEDLDDNLQSCSLVSTVFTLWAAALLMAPPPHHPMVGPFMVMVNVAVFLLAIYTLVMDTIPSAIDDYKQKFAHAQAALALVQAKMAEREEKQRKNERIRQ